MSARHRLLTAREIYRRGATGDGWCCKHCHAPFFTRATGRGGLPAYLRLLAHRLVRHHMVLLPRNGTARTCTWQHGDSGVRVWTTTYKVPSGTSWTGISTAINGTSVSVTYMPTQPGGAS